MPAVSSGAQNLRLRFLGAVGVVLLLAAWAAASVAAGSFFVPAPWTTAVDTVLLLARASSWDQVLITLLRVCTGFLLGYAAGVVAGIAMGTRAETAALLKPLVLFFQGMPPLLWAIPLVALMGIGHLPTILVITLITFPLVAVTVGEGMTTLPRELREMLAVFAPGIPARTRELVLPHLAPFLGAAVNTGLVLAVKASVTAEYFGANDGIGFQIQSAYMTLRIRTLFSWAAVLVLLILAVTWLAPRVRRAGSLLGIRSTTAAVRGARDTTAGGADLERAFASRQGTGGITLKGVSFSYRHHAAVLQDVSLAVRPGEIAVITGESGIGKTTLLKVAASLLKPEAGTVSAPARIGYVFQDDRLLPWRTVSENTAIPLVYQGFPRQDAMTLACLLLAESGLSGEEGKKPDELSGGMKKRAALARCYARLPDAILMDEPFSGLHARGRGQLWEMFLRLHALHPVPVLIVTHYPEEISAHTRCRLYTLRGSPARIMPVKKAPR